MIALRYSEFGDPADVVKPVEVERPDPGPGQVRLRLVRSPIHNHDLATIRGVYGVRPALPATGGSEMLGVVDAAGDGVAIAQGTRVVCTPQGAWAEYALAPAEFVLPVPDAIPDDRASQLLAMPLSALILLDDLHVSAGDWIVQNAANGAVAHILMREAAERGVNVVNLVRSEQTAQQLRDFGAAHVVVTEGDWVAKVRAASAGAPIVRAIDSVAGRQSMELQQTLAEGGELIVFGALSAEPMRLDAGLMISRQLIVRGFWMTALMKRPENAGRIAAAMQRVFELALKNELPLSVSGVYSLSDPAAALVASQAPGRTGKVLLKP